MSNEPNPNETSNQIELDPTKTMNNFYQWFPASKEVVSDFGDYRRLIKKLGKEDQIIGEDHLEEQNRKKHSELWLKQTYRKFRTAIDQETLERAKKGGLSMEEIQKKRDVLAQEKDYEKRERLLEELNEKLKPIFEGLLEKGYKPYDLSI